MVINYIPVRVSTSTIEDATGSDNAFTGFAFAVSFLRKKVWRRSRLMRNMWSSLVRAGPLGPRVLIVMITVAFPFAQNSFEN
jgi:hypothetical protein